MPSAEPGPVVLWRLDDALLAVALDAVEEVAAVDGSGLAMARTGGLDLTVPPGLDPGGPAAAAVVIRGGEREGGRIALAAHAVEGVVEAERAGTVPAPAWLGTLGGGHVRGLILFDDRRVAALLDADALFRGR